ncbi:MAG: ABC transporter permease [Chloroflexota bacterium]|nr:ABC transporter permease [Chloroflexota bacterium]
MSKLLSIIWKEVYITFTDRSLLLILIVTPLALSTIIGSAFSGFIQGGGNDVPVRDIAVALVNLDSGSELNGEPFNSGQTFVDLLVPSDSAEDESNALLDLTNTTLLTDAAAARAGVDDGTYRAAIIIPEDFTRSMTYSQNNTDIRVSPVEVYTSPDSPVSASIMRSITENITRQFVTGNVTVAATINTLVAEAQTNLPFGIAFAAASANGEFAPDFAPAFDPTSTPITIQQQTVSGQVQAFNPLVAFGAAQALFFMTFTAIQGANDMLQEKRNGTLQRLLVSPTSRMTVLLGKLLGALVTCVVQVVLLFFFLNIVGILLSGQLSIIWGNNLLLVLAVIIAGSLAACGIGAIVTALARTPEQVNVVGGLIAILFGLFSGAFFSIQAIPALAPLSRVTPNYWGVDAFTRLAQGNTDIATNLLVLVIIGAVTFVIGLSIFDRRLNV